MKSSVAWVCGFLILLSLFLNACALTEPGAAPMAKACIRRWAEEQGWEVTGFEVRENKYYLRGTVTPAERANGITAREDFTVNFALRRTSDGDWVDWEFRFISEKQDGNWKLWVGNNVQDHGLDCVEN